LALLQKAARRLKDFGRWRSNIFGWVDRVSESKGD